MKLYKIGASGMMATYIAGSFVAESPEEACQKAREHYRNSNLGRTLKDAAAFRFYVTDSQEVTG